MGHNHGDKGHSKRDKDKEKDRKHRSKSRDNKEKSDIAQSQPSVFTVDAFGLQSKDKRDKSADSRKRHVSETDASSEKKSKTSDSDKNEVTSTPMVTLTGVKGEENKLNFKTMAEVVKGEGSSASSSNDADNAAFVEPRGAVLGQQNPWAIQYSARLWEQGSKNNSQAIIEAEKRVMRLADSTHFTLSMVFSGISNISPNDFVDNCHRSISLAKYRVGDEEFFFNGGTEGDFTLSSANSANVAILTAKDAVTYDRLLGLDTIPYIKYHKYTKNQTVGGR